jgi:hypothetical protein
MIELKAIIYIILFCGILCMSVEITKIYTEVIQKEPESIYRYIPRTFEEEQADPVTVSEIFETMFSQSSPWLGSIKTYDTRKQESINKYFVSQF